MRRLRAAHWLAVALAPILIVAAYCSTRMLGGSAEETEVGESRADRSTGVSGMPPPQLADVAEEDTASTDETVPPEPEPIGPVAPLTGLPVDGPIERPALVVKIDNHPQARPQTGLEQADLVFDMRAEGVTRFAAVFHSTVANPVGPVRSSRTSDFDILRGFDTPLYGSSGGNNYVAAGLRDLPIIEVTNLTRREYFRDRSRSAPHNLYVDASDLFALAPDDFTTPEPWFAYRGPNDVLPPTAEPVTGAVMVAFTGSPLVTHRWDEEAAGWARTQDGAPHTTHDGDQLAPENVVIMVTDYSISAADVTSPEVRSTGAGPLYVLTDAHVITGSWERPTATDKPTLLDDDGRPILLTAGRTWILLPEAGQVEVGTGGAARLDGS